MLQHELMIFGDVGVDAVDHLRIGVTAESGDDVRVHAGDELPRDPRMPEVVLSESFSVLLRFFGLQFPFRFASELPRFLRHECAYPSVPLLFRQLRHELFDRLRRHRGFELLLLHFDCREPTLELLESRLHGVARPGIAFRVSEDRTFRVFFHEPRHDLHCLLGHVDHAETLTFPFLRRKDPARLCEVDVTCLDFLRFLRTATALPRNGEEITEFCVRDHGEQCLEFLRFDDCDPRFDLGLLHAGNRVVLEPSVSRGPVECPVNGGDGVVLCRAVPRLLLLQPLADVQRREFRDEECPPLLDEGLAESPVALVGLLCPVLFRPGEEIIEDGGNAVIREFRLFFGFLRHELEEEGLSFLLIFRKLVPLPIDRDVPVFPCLPVPDLVRPRHDRSTLSLVSQAAEFSITIISIL